MLSWILKKIVGTQNERELRRLIPAAQTTNALEAEIQKLSDEELRNKTEEFKERLIKKVGPEKLYLRRKHSPVLVEKGDVEYEEYQAAREAIQDALDELLPEAFAVVREAGRRVLKMRHFDVQLIGGMVLHQGKIAEMATGEGKTLVATLPVYLNALTGKGVHVVTVNDYLARRDRAWMGPLYEFLGLTIGVIQHDMDPEERKKAYACDITYGTNNEYGFDYLRDNMVIRKEDRVQQRGLHYAIVDEVDSILIDEARTPLIISGPAEESTEKYYVIDRIIPRLEKEKDYQIDEKANTVNLTETGIHQVEEMLAVKNLYEDVNMDLVHHVNQALKAHTLFQKDVDYVVKDGEVLIVDEFTGRLMPGRRYSDGLHQALEAKEGVTIERENQTLASITFQNYFRMYDKLSGMTGTAATEAQEFHAIYRLDVIVIPANKPMRRTNHPDVIYRSEREKFNAVIAEIAQLYKQGRPVLVGTISIDKSEKLSALLTRKGIPHHVLNAKYHEKEAEIIARAGQKFSVTISTNMAGRGTDIILGEGIAGLGGLHVLGTERHEARRIDNQLRGRSGRQGDPGSSRFYLSLEDDLMRIFGGDRISGMMSKLGMEEGQDIQHPLVTRSIETAQKRVESRNFEIRKHLLEYDNVMNKQREVIYQERNEVIEGEDLRSHVLEMIEETIRNTFSRYVNPQAALDQWDLSGLTEWARRGLGLQWGTAKESGLEAQQIEASLLEGAVKSYQTKEEQLTAELMRQLERSVLLQIIDSKWKDHLYAMDNLREGIGLRAYGQRDPLVEYQHEAYILFTDMVETIKQESVEMLLKVQLMRREPKPARGVLEAIPQKLVHETTSALAGAPLKSASHPPLNSSLGGPQPVHRAAPKVGRNDPCPCGSGKKYKKCCGAV